jgi:hypothetical protein
MWAQLRANQLWNIWVREWDDWERLYGGSELSDRDFFAWFQHEYRVSESVVTHLQQMTAVGDRDATLTQWATDIAREMIADRLVTATSQAVAAQQGIQLFNWADLCNQPDRYPHLAILGSTGSGKTVLTEWLLHQMPGSSKVITTKRRPNQWRGLQVLGTPRNFEAIEEGLQQLLQMMGYRTAELERMEHGDFTPFNVAIDEYPAIAANIKDVAKYITTLLREARETRIRLLLLLQGQQVKTLGLEGQSDLRDCLSFLRLGSFATKHANSVLPPDQAAWVTAQRYPCMVGDTPATVPDLSNWAPATVVSESISEGFNPKYSETSETQTAQAVSGSIARFGLQQLPAETAKNRIAEMRNAGMNQSQIILAFWGAKAGDNSAYKLAVTEYRYLMD